MSIGLDLIDEDRAMLAAVTSKVALPVAVQVEAPDPAAASHGLLPDGGVDHSTAPVDIAR